MSHFRPGIVRTPAEIAAIVNAERDAHVILYERATSWEVEARINQTGEVIWSRHHFDMVEAMDHVPLLIDHPDGPYRVFSHNLFVKRWGHAVEPLFHDLNALC